MLLHLSGRRPRLVLHLPRGRPRLMLHPRRRARLPLHPWRRAGLSLLRLARRRARVLLLWRLLGVTEAGMRLRVPGSGRAKNPKRRHQREPQARPAGRQVSLMDGMHQ